MSDAIKCDKCGKLMPVAWTKLRIPSDKRLVGYIEFDIRRECSNGLKDFIEYDKIIELEEQNEYFLLHNNEKHGEGIKKINERLEKHGLGNSDFINLSSNTRTNELSDNYSKDLQKYIEEMQQFIYNDNKDNIPNCCKGCPNHPVNGGSGICHCVAPMYENPPKWGITC